MDKLSNRLSALAEKAQETDDDLRYFGAKGRTNADREQLAIELVNALTTLSARVEALEAQQLSVLTGFYLKQPAAVAEICDTVLDRSGARKRPESSDSSDLH